MCIFIYIYLKLCFTWRVTATGVTGAAHTVLQPGAVGEGVTRVWRPSRGQTLLKENVCMHIRHGQFKTARLTSLFATTALTMPVS